MNTELLRKVQAAILKEPTTFDMGEWFLKNDKSPCGTTGCIAGHTLVAGGIIGTIKQGLSTAAVCGPARGLLDLEYWQGERLFFAQDWPQPFQDKYFDAEEDQDYPAMAKIASDRIDHFIATEGKE